MIKVGVIGYGFSAKVFHLPLIESSKELKLVALYSSKPDEVKKNHPNLTIHNNVLDLIVNSEVELVIITAPNSVHFSIAKLCIENNKHVVLEKPMVTTSDDAKALIELAKKQNCLLSVFHNRRWDGDFLTIKKIIKNNDLGDIRFFESHFDRFRPVVQRRWKEQPGSGAGIWFDLGSHLIDQAICLFGMPRSVTAKCIALRHESKVTDYFHVLLHYSNLEVILHSSPFTAGPNTRFRLEGNKGSYIKYGLDPQELQLKEGLTPLDEGFGLEDRGQHGTLYKGQQVTQVDTDIGCYQEYYSGIARAINNKGISPVSSEDALKVIRILELALMSSEQSQTIYLD